MVVSSRSRGLRRLRSRPCEALEENRVACASPPAPALRPRGASCAFRAGRKGRSCAALVLVALVVPRGAVASVGARMYAYAHVLIRMRTALGAQSPCCSGSPLAPTRMCANAPFWLKIECRPQPCVPRYLCLCAPGILLRFLWASASCPCLVMRCAFLSQLGCVVALVTISWPFVGLLMLRIHWLQQGVSWSLGRPASGHVSYPYPRTDVVFCGGPLAFRL